MGYIGSDFFPGNDKGEFYLQMEINKDASLEQTNFLVQKAENYLAQKPEIERMITTVGQASDGMMNVGGTKYKAEIHIILESGYNKVESTKVYSAKLKREMENVLVGAKLKTVNRGIMGAEQAPLMMTIVGASPQDALETARPFAELLRGVPGASRSE